MLLQQQAVGVEHEPHAVAGKAAQPAWRNKTHPE
jgi:hypothetical protein